jgi:hypothetical protein
MKQKTNHFMQIHFSQFGLTFPKRFWSRRLGRSFHITYVGISSFHSHRKLVEKPPDFPVSKA